MAQVRIIISGCSRYNETSENLIAIFAKNFEKENFPSEKKWHIALDKILINEIEVGRLISVVKKVLV